MDQSKAIHSGINSKWRLVIVGAVSLAATLGLANSNIGESEWLLRRLAYGYELGLRAYYAGDAHQCNICGREMGRFRLPADNNKTWECPFCISRSRHRIAWKYFQDKTDLFDGRPKSVLHIAPEPSIGPRLQSREYIDYLSGDLRPDAAMVVMDITDIRYPDNSFDVIYCSHVLEHVPDDGKAMREFYRVLKPGGWAVLAVPIRGDVTVEDPTVTDPREREKLFGQDDHVRQYGKDFKDRLQSAGFHVKVDDYASGLPDEVVTYHRLSREDIYYCEKRPPGEGAGG